MSEPENCRELKQTTDSRSFRNLLCGGCIVVFALLLCFCVALWRRGEIQRSKLGPLLRFEASIHAEYGDHNYEPSLNAQTGKYGSGLRIIHGSGQRASGFVVVDEPPPSVAWIPAIFGEYCLTHVTDIAIADERFSDADVDLLLAFPDLREIRVADTAITDEGLAKLGSFKRLEALDVSGTQITTTSLTMLANCKELRELELWHVQMDDEAVECLQQALPNCWIGH